MLKGTVDIYGLDEIKEYINPVRINKGLAQGIGLATLGLHSALKHAVFSRYNVRQDAVDKALVGRSTSSQTFGRNIILNGLTYKAPVANLAKFPYTSYPGNINPGARRKGKVHVRSVRRGTNKIIYGKEHRGGFTQRYKGRVNMYERKSEEKYPLRILWGPTTVDLINNVFSHSPIVAKELDRLENKLLDFI